MPALHRADSRKGVPAAACVHHARRGAPPTWLQNAHAKLDRAVCTAYGWEYAELVDGESGEWDEEEVLRRLLALNLERAGF